MEITQTDHAVHFRFTAVETMPKMTLLFDLFSGSGRLSIDKASSLRIPEDIEIVGFDNIDGAASAAPPLTTLAVDKEALGRMGMQLLLDDAPAQIEVVLPVELIQRVSTLGNGALS